MIMDGNHRDNNNSVVCNAESKIKMSKQTLSHFVTILAILNIHCNL